jgi:hypothetical protein
MKSRSLIIAGCLLALGIASCDTRNEEEPAADDTTVVRDTTPAPVDVADTTLIEKTRVDTAIITQDTTVKTGKTVTTDDDKTPAKSTPAKKTTSGSKSTSSGSTPTTADPSVRESEVRRDNQGGSGTGTPTESRPRR